MDTTPPDDDRTTLCETCGEWRHGRHGCVRSSEHTTTPYPVLLLQRDGPQAGPALRAYGGGLTQRTRRVYGVTRFDVDPRSSVADDFAPVYYLDDDHPEAVVLERWVAANDDDLDRHDVSTEDVTRAIRDPAFGDAWERLTDERTFDALAEADHTDRGKSTYDNATTCPRCGAAVSDLATHLPTCGEE